MITIAVSNHKGGVGKTTTAINIAAEFARQGHSTVLVDLDPQGHSTIGLGIQIDEEKEDYLSTASLFMEKRVSLSDILVQTSVPNLRLTPTTIRLARAARFLDKRPMKELALYQALKTLTDVDYAVIDTKPDLEVLTQNALVAADKILIPTQLGGFSLRGLGDLLETIDEIEEIKGAIHGKQGSTTDWRIVLTAISPRGKKRNETAVQMLASLQDHILKTQIRYSEAIEESQMEREDADLYPIVIKNRWSHGREDYRNLVKELLELWPA